MEFLLLFALLGLSASFSGLETAYFALGAAELARLEAAGGRGSRVVELLRRSHDLLSALLVGNLLVNTAASVVATSLCVRAFGAGGVVLAVPAATLALLLLGEITPKMIALRNRRPIALAGWAPLRLWVLLNRPVLALLGRLVDGVLALIPAEGTGNRPLRADELEAACDLAVADGTLSETEGRSLARLLRLGDLDAAEIMTPRTEVVAVRQDAGRQEILDAARAAGFNRYPILPAEGDLPVGFLHLKDLLEGGAGGMRDLPFIPESKNAASLLAEMRSGGVHLAAVVDEHGDFTGIVTMADCLQALIGPVADSARHDAEVVPLGEGRWVIDGRTALRELEEACGLRLPVGADYVTVAGFLMAQLGRVLQPGDRVTLPEARLTVLEMTDHRVDRIQLTLRAVVRNGSEREGAP
ncbi:MAG: HlyC/CorC family transporter [bacterium]|nr:HlyC/CorC family transporter [bacterium]